MFLGNKVNQGFVLFCQIIINKYTYSRTVLIIPVNSSRFAVELLNTPRRIVVLHVW